MYYNEQDLREVIKSEAYRDKNHPEHDKAVRAVEQGYENLYPDDDRNSNPKNYYVWRTRQDGKARDSHAEREGKVFAWDNPPEGGHPGEDYNCRCYAEPYEPPQDYHSYEKEADIGRQIKNQIKYVDNLPADDVEMKKEETSMEKAITKNTDLKKKKDEELLRRTVDNLSSLNIEGISDNIYLDTEGKITIGIGTNINNRQTFDKIDFMVDGRPATIQERQKAWDTFQDLKRKGKYGRKYGATYYAQYSSLRITNQKIYEYCEEHLKKNVATLKEEFTDFDNFPIELQEVLLDIQYNTNDFAKEDKDNKWPRLRESIKTRNFGLMVNNVNRWQVQKSRNDWAKDKIKALHKRLPEWFN